MKFTPAGGAYIQQHRDELRPVLEALADPERGFRAFLDYWHFRDLDSGEDHVLGDVLWPGQEIYVNEMSTPNAWLYLLKARQLGLSTLECAYDGYAMRFRPGPREDWRAADATHGGNAVVSIFSKKLVDASNLAGIVKYGMDRLPEWMRLPMIRDSQALTEYDAGDGDTRMLRAFPADGDTGRSYTHTHAHMDEWAFMGDDPARAWQSIEPACAGTVHFITTGNGPQNFTTHYYKRCKTGKVLSRHGTPIKPVFLDALKRPDRDKAWLASQAEGKTAEAMRQELPMTEEEALSGGGDLVFDGMCLDQCTVDALGLMDPVKERKVRGKMKRTTYVTAWDIGKEKDAAVGTVLDVTEDVHDVVAYIRLRGQKYPYLQSVIESTWQRYGGLVAVEKNSAGGAVLDNLNIPARHLREFNTTRTSKPRILQQLVLATENQTLKYDAETCYQLDGELRGYQLPDDNIVQDSVMSLAIAEEFAGEAHGAGRVVGVIRV